MSDALKKAGLGCPMKLARREFRRDPYPELDAMRSHGASIVVEANGFRMWMLTRHADALAFLSDPTTEKDLINHRKAVVSQCAINEGRRARIPAHSRRSMLDRDGEDHKRLRTMFRGVFARSMADSHVESFRSIAHEILEQLPVGNPIDLMSCFVRPLAMRFIAKLYGICPELSLRFADWENAMLTGASIEEVEAGGVQCYEFAKSVIASIRRNPSSDLFGKLYDIHDGDPETFSESELASTYIVLMVGASEVANAVGNAIYLLLKNPSCLARLHEDAGLVSNIVEECLRYESPFRLLPPRFSRKPIELGDGTIIPPGELITVGVAAANRDPLVFTDPQVFNPLVKRQQILSFGYGAHTCLGVHLARMEIGEALLAFANRFPFCEPAVGLRDVEWRSGDFMRRLDKLLVNLEPSP